MKERNRNRTKIPACASSTTLPVIPETHPNSYTVDSRRGKRPEKVFGPKGTHQGVKPGIHPLQSGNHDTYSTFRTALNTAYGYSPKPCAGFPNMIPDSCPAFTASTSQNWKRGIKLWIAGQPGPAVTQLLAKPIRILTLSFKTEALIYMGGPKGRMGPGLLPLLSI